MLGYRQKKSQKSHVLVLSTDGTAENAQKAKKRGARIHITNKQKW